MEVKDILKAMSKDNVINIMVKLYNADYTHGKDGCVMFESVCHNSSSKKLYYYHEPKKNDEESIGRNFICYVCGCSGNIIDVMENLSGLDFNGAIRVIEEETGLRLSRGKRIRGLQLGSRENSDLGFLSIHTRKKSVPRNVETIYDDSFLKDFNPQYPLCWYHEGIDEYTAEEFDIRYNANREQAIIPVRNMAGDLIGVRVRNFEQQAVDRGFKYMPLQYRGQMYRFPTSSTLYGIYENQDNIRKHGKVFLCESEKGVMQMSSFYEGEGLGLAVYGSNFSIQHRDMLLKLGIKEVTICFDKEYCEEWYDEKYDKTKEQTLMFNYFKKLKKICKMLSSYFIVNIVIDFDNLLESKDSPTDKGKETFEKLLKDKITITDVDIDFYNYFGI